MATDAAITIEPDAVTFRGTDGEVIGRVDAEFDHFRHLSIIGGGVNGHHVDQPWITTNEWGASRRLSYEKRLARHRRIGRHFRSLVDWLAPPNVAVPEEEITRRRRVGRWISRKVQAYEPADRSVLIDGLYISTPLVGISFDGSLPPVEAVITNNIFAGDQSPESA